MANPTWEETVELDTPTWQNTRGIEDFKADTEEAQRQAASELRRASLYGVGETIARAGDVVQPLRTGFNYVQGLGKQAVDSLLGYGQPGDLKRAAMGEPVEGAIRSDTSLGPKIPAATPEDIEAVYGTGKGTSEVLSGLSQAAADLLNYAKTPEGIALWQLKRLPPPARAVVAPQISAEIANQAPHILQEFSDAKARGDKAGMAKAAAAGLVTVAGTAGVMKMGAPEVTPVPAIPETPLRNHADTIAKMRANEEVARQARVGSPFARFEPPQENIQFMPPVIEPLPEMVRAVEQLREERRQLPNEAINPGLPLVSGEFPPSGLNVLREGVVPQPQIAPIKANEAMLDLIEQGEPSTVRQAPPNPGEAARELIERAAKQRREAEFPKALERKELEERAGRAADFDEAIAQRQAAERAALDKRMAEEKAAADKEAVAKAKTIHPYKPLTENQLRLVENELRIAMDANPPRPPRQTGGTLQSFFPGQEWINKLSDEAMAKLGEGIGKGWEWLKDNPELLQQILAASGKSADQLRKEMLPGEFAPALKTREGEIIPGERGKTHNDIYSGRGDSATLRTEQPEHGFVRNGEFVSREEASKLLGETEPLQSERLRELQKGSNEETQGQEKGLLVGSPLENWANNHLKGKLLSPTPEDLAALAVKGAVQLEKGVTDFSKWSKAMTDAHGPEIRSKLKQVYEQSKAIRAGTFSKPSTETQGAGQSLAIVEPSNKTPPETPGSVGLEDVYRIFEPETKPRSSIGQAVSRVVESVRTGLSSKFRPLDKLAEDIAKAYGTASRKGIAGIFEQLKGSRGRGEADIIRFDREVSSLVKGHEKDFNAYLFLRRSMDRIQQDLADGEGRRKVAGYDLETLQSKLQTLSAQLGPEMLGKFRQAADLYQKHMDNALKLQVESGRMSQEVYDAIKQGNQFYAPFKVMKYIEESSKPEGSGKRVDTLADFTKAMKGIEDPNFRLGDMLGAARQSLLLSRILADKNNVMRQVAELAKDDKEGRFIKQLRGDQEAPHGWETINVLEDGKPVKYATNPDVARALQAYGDAATGIISKTLSLFSIPFRAGATALNLPFQISNLMADVPRQALVSKYGIGFNNFLRYPFDFAHALLSSISGDVLGMPNKLFLDFLDSGVAGVTVQEHLTPRALQTKTISTARKVGENILWAIPDFAAAIEQTSKVLGVKNAMRKHGVESGAELAKRFPEAVTELRRFSGSPDFGRQGMWTETVRLNLLYMFFNARLQGAIADVGRLTGRDGAKTAAQTWFKVGTAVGLPTAYLYSLNNSDKYRDDYAQRSEQEKNNYWLIPKDTFITNEQGEKMRDYWRIPKRESAKWVANLTESSLRFAEERNPEAFKKWSQNMIEDISPVNIQGNTFQERAESVGASLNPVLKAPLEAATGRDMFRHRDIVPDVQKKASPEQQYTDTTADAFKKLADVMPDVAPEVFRSPLMLENMTKNMTAGLLTQFLKTKPVAGRTDAENQPLLRRFQASPYTDQTKVREEIEGLQREAADSYLKRHREAIKLLANNKGKELSEILKGSTDPKLIRHTIDLWLAENNGITNTERQVLALPVDQRAKFIAKQLKGLSPEQKQKAIENYARKRILTGEVAAQIAEDLQ